MLLLFKMCPWQSILDAIPVEWRRKRVSDGCFFLPGAKPAPLHLDLADEQFDLMQWTFASAGWKSELPDVPDRRICLAGVWESMKHEAVDKVFQLAAEESIVLSASSRGEALIVHFWQNDKTLAIHRIPAGHLRFLYDGTPSSEKEFDAQLRMFTQMEADLRPESRWHDELALPDSLIEISGGFAR